MIQSLDKTKQCIYSENSLSVRLGKCEVCDVLQARYTCPKCEVKTCSLPCVQIHKKELNCNGIRDRTKYIPLRKMTKMDFMSDYYFLEECTRYVADRKEDHLKSFTRYNKALPIHLYRLRSAAAERNIKLRFLLQNFSRHNENSTFYDWKSRKIFWRVEWIFINAENKKCIDERCLEENTLVTLLDKYLTPNSEDSMAYKKDFEYYQSMGIYNLTVLLKSEGIKHCKDRYFILDVTKSLKDNLSKKTIVEFPCIYITYESNLENFNIIDSDEDIECETKCHLKAIEDMKKREENNINEEVTEKEVNKIINEKSRLERKRKREEFQKCSSNYLFSDEKLWDMFSSDSENGNITEEEQEK